MRRSVSHEVLAHNLLQLLGAIVSETRKSHTVNGMANHASGKGLSVGRVSQQEVALACGFCFSVGPTLSSCVRVTSEAEETVDGMTEGDVRSETSNKEFSWQYDDSFASFRSRGSPHRAHSGVGWRTSLASRVQKTPKMARPPHNSGSIVP